MDPTILEAIPGPNPSGKNLRYDVIYGEIRARVRRARGEVLPGDFDFESTAEEDWSVVVRACRDVLEQRSKDLLIAAWLTEAQFAVDGLPGLRDSLDILRGLTENFWATLYPEIEDGDFEARLRVFELVDTRLAEAVRLALTADVKMTDTDDLVTRAARRQRNRELDACLDSLATLTSACSNRLGEESPWFANLREELLAHMSAESNLAALLADAPAACESAEDGEILKEEEPASQSPPARKFDVSSGKGMRLSDVLSPPRARAPAMPAPMVVREPQNVDFTLTAPAAVAAGVPFELFVWAHELQERSKVLARVREELHVRDLLVRSKGPFQVASGTVLSVRLAIPGAVIDEAEDMMVWEGESTCVSFVVTLPEASRVTKWAGSALIFANGVRVARVSFVMSAEGVAEALGMRYRKAFASYASDDRDAVLGRIQGIHKVVPEMEIFLDVVSLRSGQNWEQELWRVIPASDIFYLFWSTHARKSEWVEKEWRCALRERGIEFIDPIPLESPAESPPPPELSSLHFNDWMLAFRRGNPPASH
jgi:predicted component of type VI protein secretion system